LQIYGAQNQFSTSSAPRAALVGQNTFTIVTRINPGDLDALDRLLGEIGQEVEKNERIRFAEIASLHMAGIVIAAQSARRWLAHIANEISSAKRRRGEDELPGAQNNIAFTRGGLEKLGLPRDTLAAFPREFQMGIAASGAIAQAW
jgi:hypothetical protein